MRDFNTAMDAGTSLAQQGGDGNGGRWGRGERVAVERAIAIAATRGSTRRRTWVFYGHGDEGFVAATEAGGESAAAKAEPSGPRRMRRKRKSNGSSDR